MHLTEEAETTAMESLSPPEGVEAAAVAPLDRKIKPGNEERVLHGLRVLSLSYHVLCKHLSRLAKLFTQEKDIVEVRVIPQYFGCWMHMFSLDTPLVLVLVVDHNHHVRIPYCYHCYQCHHPYLTNEIARKRGVNCV